MLGWKVILCIVLLAALILIIVLQSLWIARYKKSQRQAQDLIKTLEMERAMLVRLRDQVEYKDIRQLLERRASLIGRLMAAGISGDSQQHESVLEEVGSLVAERETFMQENLQLYERWQPAMIARLRECALTDEELQICCLYAMGLNGKAIQQYTGDGRHYQNVGLIRKKLGLGEHDKNIDGYIKSLIK